MAKRWKLFFKLFVSHHKPVSDLQLTVNFWIPGKRLGSSRDERVIFDRFGDTVATDSYLCPYSLKPEGATKTCNAF